MTARIVALIGAVCALLLPTVASAYIGPGAGYHPVLAAAPFIQAATRALDYMRRVGHFEFGLDLRPINCGDGEKVRKIQVPWDNGEEVRGWARYWAMICGYVAETLARDPKFHEAAMVLRYEDLCDWPAEAMRHMMEHCRLEIDEDVIGAYAGKLTPPVTTPPTFPTANWRRSPRRWQAMP